MSQTLAALAAALPLASGWSVHSLWMRRRIESARRDPLSGLWARDAFEEQATRLLARHRNVAMILLDLDGFKAVNDSFGHAAGDAVIRATGATFADALSSPRRSVAGRIGGDEFAAAVALPDPGALPWLLGGLLGEITAPLRHAGRDLTVGASIGAVLSPGSLGAKGRDYSVLLRRADEEMYRVKKAGGGCSVASDRATPLGMGTVNGRRAGRRGTASGTGATA
ncbi:GGDEF domain-containing protein [Streptomyces sp. NPDC056670]|uniref:GGDEF domain-containing protein n=1 Tax=Streptomyces sp. NPDC056670 TaxID=3345904 RepID=UPI00368BAF4E